MRSVKIAGAARLTENEIPLELMTMAGDKVTAALWAPLDEGFVTGHESGSICHWEMKVGGDASGGGDGRRRVDRFDSTVDYIVDVVDPEEFDVFLFFQRFLFVVSFFSNSGLAGILHTRMDFCTRMLVWWGGRGGGVRNLEVHTGNSIDGLLFFGAARGH